MRTQKEILSIKQVGINQYELKSFGRVSMYVGHEKMLKEVLFFFTGLSELYPGTDRYGKVTLDRNN